MLAHVLPPSIRGEQTQRRPRRLLARLCAPLRSAAHALQGGFGRRGSYTLRATYPLESLLTESDQFRARGLHPREAEVFQRLADRYRYEIFVRTSDVSRANNVGRPGLRAKPAGVYPKTNKDKTPFAIGLVIYRDGDEPKWNRDLETIHHPDPARASLALQVLAKEGLGVRPLGCGMHGLRDGAGNFFYGDIDIHGVYRRTGPDRSERIDARTFVPQFNGDLTATGLHASSLLEYGTPMWQKDFGVLPYSPIQHGAHDEWSERNDPNYAGGVNMGPLPGVIHFRRGATPRYVATVAQYKDILASLGQAQTYSSDAWTNGRNRLAAVRYTRRDSAQQRDWLGRQATLEKTRL
jgi:insecticidal toxin complex protein TccC